MSQIKERSHHCSACLHTTSTRCQNQSTPCVVMYNITQSYRKRLNNTSRHYKISASRAQKKDSRRCPFVLIDNHASYRLVYTWLKMITSRKLFEEVNRRFSRTRSRSVTICSMNCRRRSNHFLHRQFNVFVFVYFNNAPLLLLLLHYIYFSDFFFL